MNATNTGDIGAALRAPFPAHMLGWKPQMVKGNRALAVAYIDARDVQQRLDDVVGVGAWQDEYEFLPGGPVLCRLQVWIGGAWVTKCDVGNESEQSDKGDREKAAVSDALKRAAVKFGIGRYLYSMEPQWLDYDPVRKQFTQTPQLPAQFLPPAAPKTVAKPPVPAPAPAGPADLIAGDHEALRDAETIADLVKAWDSIPPERRKYSETQKNHRKAELMKEANETMDAIRH